MDRVGLRLMLWQKTSSNPDTLPSAPLPIDMNTSSQSNGTTALNNTLACPNCNQEIELTQLMRTQVASQIRGELDAQAAARERELEKQRDEVARQKRELDKERMSVAEEVRGQVERQRSELMTEATKRAKDAVAVEIADRDERLKELAGSLATAQQQELELRKMQRQLQSEKDGLKLEVERRLDAGRKQLISEAKAQYDHRHDGQAS
jgi:hypothetical protein